MQGPSDPSEPVRGLLDIVLGAKAETKVVELAGLAREHADEIARLRKELGLRKAVMTRRSNGKS